MNKQYTVQDRLNLEKAEKGWRVVLTHPDPGYSIDETNPVLGTEYECCGTILYCEDDFLEVEWDNGMTNTYKDMELSTIKEINSCISIWDF